MKPQGEQPLDPKEGGVNIMLWPTFWAWLRKTREPLKDWEAMEPHERGSYFISLARLAAESPKPVAARRWRNKFVVASKKVRDEILLADEARLSRIESSAALRDEILRLRKARLWRTESSASVRDEILSADTARLVSIESSAALRDELRMEYKTRLLRVECSAAHSDEIRRAERARACRTNCNRIAPVLTAKALPVLRRRLKEISAEERREVNGQTDRDFSGKTLEKITPAQAQIRKRQRDAAASFIRETAPRDDSSRKRADDNGLRDWLASKTR